MTELICDLVNGNIPGVHPNILGDVMKTAEMQHVNVTKTADEEMQLEMVTPDSEASYYEVTQSKSDGDGVNVELITCADFTESAQVGHATKGGGDAS